MGEGAPSANLGSSIILPPGCTYGQLGMVALVPEVAHTFLTKLGVVPETEIETNTCISEDDWLQTFEMLTSEGHVFTALERALVVRTIRDLFTSLGRYPPSMGAAGLPIDGAWPPTADVDGTLPLVRPTADAPPDQAALVGPGPATRAFTQQVKPNEKQDKRDSEESLVEMIPLRDFLDQKLKASIKPLTWDELKECRARQEKASGGVKPPEEYKPSAEQLACLRAVLRAGRIPYADFAVFNAFGGRLANFAITEGQVWRDGVLVTQRVSGPESFEAWKFAWGLFTGSMVSLAAASLGSLKLYANGYKKLLKLFPNSWPALLVLDVIVRTEQWKSLREEFELDPPQGYDPSMPWDYVIAASSYGVRGSPLSDWWQQHFVIPFTRSGSSSVTLKASDSLDGGAAVPTGVGAAAVPDRKGRKQSRSRSRQKTSPEAQVEKSSEECRLYNMREGKCAGITRNGCPHGRRHVCSQCGKNHRYIDVHAYQQNSKGKGKGKGGKSKSKY